MTKVKLISFGFKYGKPRANFIFDISFLRNPKLMGKWAENIWYLTDEMRKYVLGQKDAKKFIKLTTPFIKFVAKKTDCVVGFGCTGGHHRSVAITDEVGRRLKKTGGFDVEIEHNDTSRVI